MPGFIDHHLGDRCPDCDGRRDPWLKGQFFHKPTCPTQPGHEEAQRLEDLERAERRRQRERWVKSPEAQYLRNLRIIGRLRP